METIQILNLLIEKWKTLLNHYKLQNDLLESRVKFLWIIQGAIFIGWRYFIKENIPLYLVSFLLVIIGIFVSYGWVIISKRHMETMLLTEMELRDVEKQFNDNSKEQITLNKLTLDKECMGEAKPHKFSDEEFSQEILKSFWELKLPKPCNMYDKIIFYIIDIMNKYMTPGDDIFFKKNKLRSISIWIGSILPKFFLLIWTILFILTFLFVFCGGRGTN